LYINFHAEVLDFPCEMPQINYKSELSVPQQLHKALPHLSCVEAVSALADSASYW